MRTLIIIPAFNEEANIERLIQEIVEYRYDYLLINDHSTDQTMEIAKRNHFSFLDLPINVGIAGVTRNGFRYAHLEGYDCAVVIDGDGQHPPGYIHKLIQEIETGNDYVVGSRFVDEKKPLTLRMLGSRMISYVLKQKTGVMITDPTSGMRAVGKKVLADFAENMNYYAEPDTLCHLLRRGYRVKEVQVTMKERQGGVSYFRNPFKSVKYMIAVLLSIIFVQW